MPRLPLKRLQSPATDFWKHYVVNSKHDRVEIDENSELVGEFAKFIAHDVKQAMKLGPKESRLKLNVKTRRLFSDKSFKEVEAQIRGSVIICGTRD